MPAFILKRREITGKVRTRYGNKTTFGRWQTVGTFETLAEAVDAQRRDYVGLYDRGVFHRGARLTDGTSRQVRAIPTNTGA